MRNTLPRVKIYHHSVWARYKGAIFSSMHAKAESFRVDASFVQVAETASNRLGFSNVDLTYHLYPYELLFKGPYERISVFKLTSALIVNLFKNPSELVVLHGYHRIEHWAMLMACILLHRKRAVFVDSTARDTNKNAFKEAAKKFFFRRCDGFFCYGVRSKEYVISYGINEKKIFFRCQAAALPHDYNAAAVLDHHAKSQNAIKTETFLYIGRLSQEKGLFDLLDAFLQFLRSRPQAILNIVGSGVIEHALRQRCAELHIDSSVHFLGTKTADQIGHLLMHSTALVLPSQSEPWGLVVNESLSYGCPVVVSDACGCVPELVHDGETGYSFATGDVAELCTAMHRVVELSQTQSSVAQNCLHLVEQYTIERAADAILAGCVSILEINDDIRAASMPAKSD